MKTHPLAAPATIARFALKSLLAATALLGSVAMSTQVITPEEERFFWSCNLAANEDRLTSSSIRECSVTYNRILAHRFGGDFLAYLAWRQANEAEQLSFLRNTQLVQLRVPHGENLILERLIQDIAAHGVTQRPGPALPR